MLDKDIQKKIGSAIQKLRRESPPIPTGKSERAFAHRLAVYMEDLFPGYNIDCEYNRKESDTKKLDGNNILTDIIAHKRGPCRNLLVIELKIAKPFDQNDANRLKKMTSPDGTYHYQLGLYVNIVNNRTFDQTWYKNGGVLDF